ncbi:hypothetical protein ES708_03719 [subsurface metagenome]
MSILNNKVVMMILPALLKSISPILVDQIQPLFNQLKETARSTSNPWDYIFIVFLEELLKELTFSSQGN